MKKKNMLVLFTVLLALFAAPAAWASSVNPFMDVPMNHWSYDAMGQLASRGVLSGYPDGTFKGSQPMTRYEAASALARSLAVVDMTKASQQDVEMLKRLVVEFKDELDNLGVQLGNLDSRVAVLEENLGGWKFWGEMRMDAKFADNNGGLYTKNGKSDFDLSRARIWMRKQVDDKTTFTTRIALERGTNALTGDDENNAVFDLAWLDVRLPFEVDMKVGKWQVDWSAADGTYKDNDSMFSNRIANGFYFSRQWGSGETAAYVSREEAPLAAVRGAGDETLEYGFRGKIYLNENLWASANYMKRKYDGDRNLNGFDESVVWGTVGVAPVAGVEGRISYYSQKLGENVFPVGGMPSKNTSPDAWHVSVDVDQSKLFGFSSLRVEYMKPDSNFRAWTDGPWDMYGAAVTGKELGRYDSILFLSAEQRWNDKWATFERYLKGNARDGVLPAGFGEDTANWTLGVRHHYTPALSFELAYDHVSGSEAIRDNDDHMLRFRTNVVF